MRHALCWGFIALGVAAWVPVARGDDSSVAEQLFREGKRLLGEGKVAKACEAFEGSFRKDAAITTLLNLADCRERNGQFATAWGYFLDVERMGRGQNDAAAYRDIGKDRAAKLEKRLSYLIINVPADATVEGLQILRNGKLVDPAEWNTDIPVDGGEYAVEGKAPGYEAWSTKVTVKPERDKASVNVPRFRSRPRSEALDGGADGGAERGITRVETSPEGSRSKVGIVVLAGGGVAILAGLSVGYLAQQKYGEAEDLCGSDRVCDTAADQAAAQDLTDQARMRGNISTVITAAGVVGVGVGAFLWIRSGRARTSSQANAGLRVDPLVGRDVVGLAVGGSL
ncbi:MAG: hypothetical protein F9K40_09405 [Kofleriaceae bacterium]|nr:MAG: hypothetical protein F9K40_09405 [Kofleriaceae bacterium]MBZ0238825.1 hypothetical protein [Kofleriaceae bacterium]